MAIDFPNSPSINQTFTVGDTTYIWDGVTWDFLDKNASYIDFDVTTYQNQEARLIWDDGEGTLSLGLKGGNVNLQLGQENVAMCYNGTGSTIPDGSVVYISGAQGQRPRITLAQANSEATSSKVFGITTENIANGAEGFVTTFGIVNGVDTSAFTAGQALWLSPTVAGGLTATKPVAPNHLVFVGYAIKINASSGRIFVNPQNGYELDELHDVLMGTKTDRDVLMYESSTGLWKNEQINLGTDTVGNYVASVSGTTNEIEVSGTGEGAAVTIGLPNDVTIGNNLIVTGNLTVNGTTTTVNSTTMTVDDPIITLGGDTAPVADDNKDRGIEFRYFDTQARLGFMGYDDSAGTFVFLTAATNTSEVFSGTKGTIDANISGSNINAGTVSATYIDSAIARLASPTFTGTVTVPTLSLTTADTATAASHYFVETASDGVVRPKTLANVKAEILASPTLTGTITTPLTTAGYVTTTAGGVLGSVATIPNAGLTNSSITVNGTAISLGSSGTVTAAAGTLTGATLNATVTGSSLTSVGTITSGTWQGSVISAAYIDSAIARLASPAFTGTPTAPTATAGTNTTQIATTAFVIGQEYAKLASPTFTGTPAAPTAAVDTNTTQIATTAYVVAQGYLKAATASSTYSPIASPTFTGTVTAPKYVASGAQTLNEYRMRNIIVSTTAPGTGNDGDIWLKY